MNSENTGKLIQEARLSQGLTQAQLGEALHISDKTVSKWERGKGFPDISLLEPLAEILGLSVASLLAGEVVEEPISGQSISRAAGAFHRQRRRITWRQIVDAGVKGLLLAGVLGFIFLMLEYNGVFNKKIALEVPVGIYIDGQLAENSTVFIEGELSPWGGRRHFWGRFAISYVERTCREDMSCQITWDREYGVQNIAFASPGKIYLASELGLCRYIYMTDNMQSFALKMTDGTVIATDLYYVPLISLDYYYALSYKSVSGNSP